MFINVSNHSSVNWSTEQYTAAAKDGQVIDLLFPSVDPCADKNDVCVLAQEYYRNIRALAQRLGVPAKSVTVMVAGEFTFTYHLVELLLHDGYRVVSACTKREAVETDMPDGSVIKEARFMFVQFREY